MSQIYKCLGYSKQAFHQKMDRYSVQLEQHRLLLPIIAELRQEHPGVAARQLYRILRPEGMGRDRFESLCFEHGFMLERPKAYKRTTDSRGVVRFPNLVAARELTHINQVWSSDITYYAIDDRFYYITFIMDLYSRRIVGHSVSGRLTTEQTTIAALAMAYQQRRPLPGLIFHSDAGGQYYCKEFLQLTQSYQIKNSMCDIVFENAHAERINRTIKEQYLKGYNPRSFLQLVQMTKRAVHNYNFIKPHHSLKNRAPVEYEKLLPAGGSSLSNDDFCSFGNTAQHHQKNNHLPKRSEMKVNQPKAVEKTVNVF